MLALLFLLVALAQQPATNNVLTPLRQQHQAIGELIVAAAERIPDAEYGFRPSADVRSVAELLLHIAGYQYVGCPFVAGTKGATPPLVAKNMKMETWPAEGRPTRTEIIAAVRESFAACERVLGEMSAESANRIVKAPFFARLLGMSEGPAYAYEVYNLTHTWEHYGNLVTYMRLRGLVPPTTGPR